MVEEASEAVTFWLCKHATSGRSWVEAPSTAHAFLLPQAASREKGKAVFCFKEVQKQVLPKEWKKLNAVFPWENTLFAIPPSSGTQKLD